MRDGVATRANVFRLGGARRGPAVLVRTPYGKDSILGQNTTLDPVRAVESGYAVVFQDVRGRYESDGELAIFDEAGDGVDSIEWVAHQPWCDGNVGMTVELNPVLWGRLGVDVLAAYLKGERTEQRVFIKHVIIDPANVDDAISRVTRS